MNLVLRAGTPSDAERCGTICYEAFGLYGEPRGAFLPSILY